MPQKDHLSRMPSLALSLPCSFDCNHQSWGWRPGAPKLEYDWANIIILVWLANWEAIKLINYRCSMHFLGIKCLGPEWAATMGRWLKVACSLFAVVCVWWSLTQQNLLMGFEESTGLTLSYRHSLLWSGLLEKWLVWLCSYFNCLSK